MAKTNDLFLDEQQYIEILRAFNEKICVPVYRNGAEMGLDNKVIHVFAGFSKLHQVHKSLYAELNEARSHQRAQTSGSSTSDEFTSNIFAKHLDDFMKIDVHLIMEPIYECIEPIFELSHHSTIVNMMRRFNYEHSFTDIDNHYAFRMKEEPQLLSYLLFLALRLVKYTTKYQISCLLHHQKLHELCNDLYYRIDCALYLLSLQQQISQCQIKLFIKNRVLVRLEKLNMEAGKFKKKHKKRLILLFNDRIVWCSILSHPTKRGHKYKYKGSYKLKDAQFEIKSFYAVGSANADEERTPRGGGGGGDDNNKNNNNNSNMDDNESMYSAMMDASQPTISSMHDREQFGFKFGLSSNDKSFKLIVCTEQQQQLWYKDMNRCIVAPSTAQLRSTVNLQSIELLESFIKHSTSWNRDKIWHKIFDSKSQKSLLSIVLSLFDDLLSIKLSHTHQQTNNNNNSKLADAAAMKPPPIPAMPNASGDYANDDNSVEEEEEEEEDGDEEADDDADDEHVDDAKKNSNSNNHDEDGDDDDDNKSRQSMTCSTHSVRVQDVDEETMSTQSDECDDSLSSFTEVDQLRKELSQFKQRFQSLQNEYKSLQNENARLSARNVFINNRLVFFSENQNVMTSTAARREHKRGRHDEEEEEEDDDCGDEAANKYIQMISHKRRNSDSTLMNKSPSFLSTLRDEHSQIDKDAFSLTATATARPEEEKRGQPSKSRDEKVYNQQHKRKQRNKNKY